MGKPIVHFEIGCRDMARTSKFYADLFEWSTQDFGPATMINTGDGQGIHGHINALGHEPHNYVTIYAQVEDLQAYLDKAEKLGGKTVVPPTQVPNAGAFAWLSDPEGNIVGLWKPQG